MISRSDFDLYCSVVDALAESASGDAEGRVLQWCADNPGASTAEAREAAKAVLAEIADVYSAAAASLGAEWYDETVAATVAATMAQGVFSSTAAMGADAVDAVARYQAGKYADGDAAGFAKACGDYASDVAKQAVNNTVAANAKRDRASGVRYARVPTGFETCTFCIMLASRGAVYWTRETAGEMNHYHRHCDCKIVAGSASDPMAVLVEGCDPKEYKALWQRYQEVDDSDLSTKEKDAVKVAWADSILGDASSKPAAAELAGMFQDGADAAWRRFSKTGGKDAAAYEKTVNAYLSAIGDAYGIDLRGGAERNVSGTLVFARPNGDELYAVTRAAHNESLALFRVADRSSSPDLSIDGVVTEVKTVKSWKKTASRLAKASNQLAAAEAGGGSVILDISRADDPARAIEVAQRFTEDGTLDEITIIHPDGSVSTI